MWPSDYYTGQHRSEFQIQFGEIRKQVPSLISPLEPPHPHHFIPIVGQHEFPGQGCKELKQIMQQRARITLQYMMQELEEKCQTAERTQGRQKRGMQIQWVREKCSCGHRGAAFVCESHSYADFSHKPL